MEVIDRERENEWIEQMDTILIFAALFAGFLSAFLIELLNRLEPDPLDTIQDVLIYQTQMMRNSSLGPYVPADFSPSEYIVVVNALFYASLGVMLLAAFIAMLIKSWVREFDRGLRAISIPEQRAKTREFRYLGMEHWKLQEMVAMLPLLIQISLLLFAVGLVLFLFHISKPSFGVTTAIFGIGVFYYALTTTISVFVTSSPFHSPLSRALGKVYQRVHAYFCPGLDKFLSPDMDTTPVTVLGRLGRRIQIFLQKSRPYLESAFVESIETTSVDEVQLSTTASALRRIHDSVPNSQHSELIQQSVWQVAGSPVLRIPPSFKLPSWILDRGNDKEYFSWLSPMSAVALTAVFVRIRDPRYKKRIVVVADLCRSGSDSGGPWAQLVHAIFDLLPGNFFPDDYHEQIHPAALRDALRRDFLLRDALLHDALLRDALPDTPFFDTLRNSLLRNTLHRAVFRGAPYGANGLLSGVLRRNMGVIVSVILGVVLGGGMGSLFGRSIGRVLGSVLGIALLLLPLLRDALSDYGALHGIPFAVIRVLKALLYVSVRLRDTLEDASLERPLRNALLRNDPFRSVLRLFYFGLRGALLGNAHFDSIMVQGRIRRAYIEPEEPNNLIAILRTNQLQDEESIWLLNTLSGLHCDGLVLAKHHVSKICLTIILQSPNWSWITPPNIVLVEAVVTLAAISCSSNEIYQMKTLANSHQHPWLLLNLRNPDLFSKMIENMDHSRHRELITLLFVIICALTLRGSSTLAAQHLTVITPKYTFAFCASALMAIAPALGGDGFSAIGGLLLAPQTRFLPPEDDGSNSDLPRRGPSQGLLNSYDVQLGANQFPDPKIFVVLLLLSKKIPLDVETDLQECGSHLELKNPWLRLIARVIARIEILDEPGLNSVSFHDRRVHNMFAALCLRQYPVGDASYYSKYGQFLLLASFFESRELAISSSALYHHMRTAISSSDLPLRFGRSDHFSGAVHALFSPILPGHYLPKGWKILHELLDEFEYLPIQWRQTFAEAFFTMSRRPRMSENRQKATPVTELNEILTWEYFCKEEQEPEFTNTEFSGLDWMAMAWSLHLSQQSGTKVTGPEGQPLGRQETPENEEFVLKVLYRLLYAAPRHSIIPIIPKLHEFVDWFDDPMLSEHKRRIQAMTSVRDSR